MPNLEVTISPEYVGGWGFNEAFRELLQNGIDQQTVNPENKLLVDYDPQLMTLRIGNRTSNLDPSTLVLGNTSKASDERTVGKFGEGYKLALIVLLRLGKSVTIYNSPNVWTPSIRKSEQFNTPVLNINIVKYRFKQLPEHDLIFSINGVTSEEWGAVQDRNIHFHDEPKALAHEYGRILLDERYRGLLYVNGLFITVLKDCQYGYDINPQYLEIGRDRDLVDSWSVLYKTSTMWAAQKDAAPLVDKLVADKARDVSCLDQVLWHMPKHTVEYIGGMWYKCHGCNAVPVTSQEEADRAKATYGEGANIVMVNEQLGAILKRCPEYKQLSANAVTRLTPLEILQALLDHPDKDRYKREVREDLEEILELAKHWRWKTI